MKHVWAFSLLSLLFTGCATTSAGDVQSAPQVVAPSDSGGDKLEGLERKLHLARARLSLKQLEERAFVQQLGNKVRYAEAALVQAEADLAKFREVDLPNRIASARLDLRTTTDRAQEAKDELAQIEIMYKDQDLDDLTAEFVVSRGRRRAERAQARIEIEERKVTSLEERELPRENMQFELALDKAKSGLRTTEIEGEIGRKGKAISIQEAQNTILKLEQEIAEAKQDAKP